MQDAYIVDALLRRLRISNRYARSIQQISGIARFSAGKFMWTSNVDLSINTVLFV